MPSFQKYLAAFVDGCGFLFPGEFVANAYMQQEYCKTLYFHCILISQFWNVEILLHFNLAFSHCSTSIYQAFDGKLNFRGI